MPVSSFDFDSFLYGFVCGHCGKTVGFQVTDTDVLYLRYNPSTRLIESCYDESGFPFLESCNDLVFTDDPLFLNLSIDIKEGFFSFIENAYFINNVDYFDKTSTVFD